MGLLIEKKNSPNDNQWVESCLVTCMCGSEGLGIHVFIEKDDNIAYFHQWEMRSVNRFHFSWFRIKMAWQQLRYGRCTDNEIMLTKEDCIQLADYLYEKFKEKENTITAPAPQVTKVLNG